MKNSRKILSLVLSFVLLLALPLSLFGCKSKPVIGVIQFGTHESLNNCYEGILEGLKAGGVNLDDYDVRCLNSNFDVDSAAAQATSLVNAGAKVILGIATPTAVAAANASDGKLPVVYCAVTDDAIMKNYSAICGSSDRPNYVKTLELVTSVMGRGDLKIGVISHTSEDSDAVMISDLKEAAKAYAGMEIDVRYLSDITTIGTLTASMISSDKVDCFLNLLDNTVVGQLTNILAVTDEAKIPVFGSEIEQVKAGCIAASSIDYNEVGAIAGGMAAKILAGTSADSLGCKVVSEPTAYYSSAVCEKLGIAAPADPSVIAVESLGK